MKKKFMPFLMPLVALTVVIFMSYSFIPVSEFASEVEEVPEVFVEKEALAEDDCGCPRFFQPYDLTSSNLDEETLEMLSAVDRNEDDEICKLRNIPALAAGAPGIPGAVGTWPDIFTDNRCN